MMLRGSVKFFDETKGWGFIVPGEPGADVYVHWKSCLNSYVPQAGDIVNFELIELPDGQRAARKVELAK